MRGLVLVLVGLGLAAPARANPLDAFQFGSRAGAMAGAATAVSDDAAANYYNPGALARARRLGFDIGYQVAQPYLSWNGRRATVDATRGFALGLVAPGSIGPFRFAFGVGLWLPDQRLTRVRALALDTPRFVYYDNRTQRLWMSANLAVQIVPGLYVGAGLTFMSRTRGEILLRGNVAVTDPDDSALVTNIDVDLIAVRYPQAGIRWDATRKLSFGLSYRHSYVLRLDQQFRVEGSIGNPGVPPVVDRGYFFARSVSTDLFQPWQLTAGMAAQLLRRLLISFDATYARWSEYPVPAADLSIDLDLGATFNNLVKLPMPRTYPSPGFHDVLIPRLGMELRALDGWRDRLSVDVRAGYAYEPSPAPDQLGESNLLDNDKHTWSIGAGLRATRFSSIFTGTLHLDLHLAVTHLVPRSQRKLDPLDPVGDLRTDGAVVQGGITLRTRF